MGMIKAYEVQDKNECLYATIVFAETRGKAIALAQHTDACEDAEFTRITARRVPQMDKYYRGRSEMDWLNAGDRIAMCKDAGFACSSEVWEPECEMCSAKDCCHRYQDRQEEAEY